MARLALVCLASLVAVTIAGPAQKRQEKTWKGKETSDTLKPIGKCHEKDNLFKSGNTYEYKYFGKAETGLGYGDSKTVGLALECKVRLSVPEPCEYHMKVSECQVFEHDGTEDDSADQEGHRSLEEEVDRLEERTQVSRRGFKASERSQEMNREVSKHAIQAQVADGEIDRVIYQDDEQVWVVNFKKAILDALQVDIGLNSKQGSGEGLEMINGIHGLCPTKFSEKSTTDRIVIEKDLDSCIHARKNYWELSPLTPVFNMSLVAKVMKAESVCAYKLNRNSHIEAMTCRESHQFLALPWTKVAAATANVTQTLRFQRKEQTATPMERNLSDKTVTSILYEHENVTDVQRKNGQGEADEILKDLVKKAMDGFDIDAPAIFDDFVDELRDSSNLEDVISAARGMKDNEQEVAKYLLVQGLAQCNAPACLRALTTLMQADEIPRAIFEPVVMALALTKQQDPLFLDEVKRICEARPTRTCALMVGALAYKLVDEDDDILDDPETAKPIEDAAQFLSDLIEDGKCDPSDKLDKAEEDSDSTKLIIALKAIGNLGHVAQKVQQSSSRRNEAKIEDKIAKCLSEDTPDNVTVAAIHALRRFVPTREISAHLLKVLGNEDESPEVRMAACMASVRMVSDKTDVRKIVELMEREKSDQVKAFIVSHLRAVLRSEDPNYKKIAEDIKTVLREKGQTELPKIKARMPHSLHIELSKFFEVPFLADEENDFGVQIESVSMFSTKSYLPKSLQLNVSTQVFGDYINVLETGVDMEGVEDLVEKVLGPRGILSKSKAFKKAREFVMTAIQTVEELGYKHFRFEDAKEFARKAFELLTSKKYETVVDQVLTMIQELDTHAFTEIFSHMRTMDTEKILDTIRRNIPRSAQLSKTIEKLKRIRFQEPTTETLVEVLEAFGITQEQARDIIKQAKNYGVNVDKITEWIRRTDIEQLQEQLQNLRIDDIKQKYETFARKIQELINWFTERCNLPSLRSLVEMVKDTYKDPSEIKRHAKKYLDSRPRDEKNRKPERSNNYDEDDDEDDEDEDERNDYESLDMMPWGRQVKNFKRGPRDEDGDGKDDDEDFDITAFIRIFGDEIGFISLSDLPDIFDIEQLQKQFDLRKIREAFDDILDGFDVQPTFAAKFEGVHHISTGLGLPLQLTLNVTGIATIHMKAQPEGRSLQQSRIEFEPGGALQVASGMTIDLPSITSIAVVSNTTIKSEFEIKMRLDTQIGSIDLEIEKPDEELDIIHFRHEVKLVKDDEDFSPFDNAKSHEVKKEKCLPENVERITGLKICAELETSSLKGSPMLSHGPHELRVSFKESEQSGLKHVKFSGKRTEKDQQNHYELNVRAPGHQQNNQRSARAVLVHDRKKQNFNLRAGPTQESTPRVHIFARVLDDGQVQDDQFGIGAGIDVELADDKHYNISAMFAAMGEGAILRSGNTLKEMRINFTVGVSVQAPLIAVNLTTTTAKFDDKIIMMEHNLTYRIEDELRIPALQKLHFPGSNERDDISKFTLRHGVEVKSDRIAHDVQAFIQLLTFPRLEVAEPTIHYIAQVKVHRDFRHIGLHSNTTWLNDQDEVEFYNASATTNNIFDLTRLEQREVTVDFTVQTNDWKATLENQLKKESGEIKLTHDFNAKGMVPECDSVPDCAWKRIQSEIRNMASIGKPRTANVRPHKHHRLRQQRTRDAETTYRQREMSVVVENRFGEKKDTKNENGFWNQRKHRDGQEAYRVTTRITAKATGEPKKDLTAVTYFGNDAKERNAILSWYFVHNATATNTAFSLDHFSHFLVNQEDGLVFTTISSVDKDDKKYVEVTADFQIDPQDLEAKAEATFDTPLLDGSGKVEVRKTGRSVKVKVTTKADSQLREAGFDIDFITHELEARTKLSPGKVVQSVTLRHAKLDTDFKADFDLFGGADSGIDEQDDEQDDDENDDQDNEADTEGRHGAFSQERKGPKDPRRPSMTRSKQGRGRSVRSASRREENRDREQENNSQDDETNDRLSSRSKNRPQGRRNSARDSGEDTEDNESRTGKSKYNFDSLRKRFAKIKPTLTSNLKIKSKDREMLPSFTVDAKLTPRHSKVDVQIQEVPRSLEGVVTSKRLTVQGDVEQEKATLKVVVDRRGEAGTEITLRGERNAEAKIYDRDMTKSGETVHAKVSLELPTEDTVRTKFYVNPESGPRMARAVSENAISVLKASTRTAKDKTDEVIRAAKQIYSDPQHPFYRNIRRFFQGSMQQWNDDFMKQASKYDPRDRTRAMYEDDKFFGTSLKELVRKIDQERKKWTDYALELVDETPIEAIMDALPTTDEIRKEVEKVADKHFPEQTRVFKKHQRTFSMDAFESLDDLRKLEDVVVDLANSFDQVKARQFADKAAQSLRDLLLDFIKGFKEQVRRNEPLRKFAEMLDIKAIEDTIRRADGMNMDSAMKAVDALKIVAQSLAGEKLRNMVQKEGDKIVITVPHPFQWKSLKELPRLTEDQRRSAYSFLEKSKRTFRDVYDDDNVHIPLRDREDGFRFKWSDVKNLHKKNLPAQTAMIFGERHIMTFDGQVYSIPEADEQCTYLMARGTRNEKFALVRSRDGVTLTLPEMSVTINSKNEVRVNNSRSVVQLPVQSANGKATVKMVGDTIEVESRAGITLKFNGEQKVYVVELSGGMWDESTGLLGTNDNEADNDWKMPTGRQASHTHEFVNAFELSRGAQCQLTRPSEAQNDRRRGGKTCKESSKCANFFRNDDSDLSSCFQTVDAAEFFELCQQETQQCNQTEAQEVVCDIVQAYRRISTFAAWKPNPPKNARRATAAKSPATGRFAETSARLTSL